MAEIGFYHLTVTPLEKALPKLLEKTLDAGERALVRAVSPDRVAWLNEQLWTYDDRSWLPHGTAEAGFPDDQPIWLTAGDENANAAKFLFLIDGAQAEDPADFTRIFNLFDGRNDEAVAAERIRWKAWRDAGQTLTYWKQTETGGWQKAG
jgi:DNA polymerase-3 subunit chi